MMQPKQQEGRDTLVRNKAQKIFNFYQGSCKLECKLHWNKKFKHRISQLYSNPETDPFQFLQVCHPF